MGERARRSVKRQYNNAVTLFLKDLPMVVLGSIILLAGDVNAIVVVALILASAVFGSKVQTLFGFRTDLNHRAVATEALYKLISIEHEMRSNTRLSDITDIIDQAQESA